MRRVLVPALAALLFGLPALAQAQQASPYDIFDDIQYYFAFGPWGSEHMALGDAYDGQGLVNFVGCGWVQLRTELERGVVRTVGWIDNTTFAEIRFENFTATRPEMMGGLADNVTLDGSWGRSAALHPKVKAQVAGWGVANMWIDSWPYNDPGAGNGAPTPEGLRPDEDYRAYFFVTPNGFRDNQTKAVRDKAGNLFDPANPFDLLAQKDENWELHFRIESLNTARRQERLLTFSPAGDLPDGSFSRTTDYRSMFQFNNTKWGGTSDVRITVTSRAPSNLPTQLTFRLLSPERQVIANHTVTASLNQDGTKTFSFPLNKLGYHRLEVIGQMHLARYTVQMIQKGPEKFVLTSWHENLEFGRQARREMAFCEDRLGSAWGEAIDPVYERPKPPGFNTKTVLLGVAGGLIGALVALRLLVDASAGSAFNKSFRKR